MAVMKLVWERITREPVLLGAAVLATVEATAPEMSTAGKLAVTAWVSLFQRALSTPTVTAKEQVETAKWVGAVEATAGQTPSP